ncbi:hypothetical protein [Thermosipho africanus]|uniref:hypothetical protein n=1 Tax=Thermosipho africanus TaxID=2421 RepID=UPI00031E247D|nr:hypothetical protein [Thermosipho africanus]
MEKIKIEDLFNFNFLSGISLSDDGKYLAFVVSKANEEKNNYTSNIWLLDTTDSKLKKLTTYGNESNFIWLDNKTILFQSIREDDEKQRKQNGEKFSSFYKISVDGGEAEKYFEIPLIVKKIKKLDSENFVILGEYNIYDNDKDYIILDEIPFWSNGAGFTNKKEPGYIFSI